MNVTDIKDVSLFPSEKILNRQQGRNDPDLRFQRILNEISERSERTGGRVESKR